MLRSRCHVSRAGGLDRLRTAGAAKFSHVGTGVTFWDLTHSDSVTPGWLGTAGVPLWTSDERLNQALFSVEYRQFFDRMSDPDVNCQFWGGLKYLFR